MGACVFNRWGETEARMRWGRTVFGVFFGLCTPLIIGASSGIALGAGTSNYHVVKKFKVGGAGGWDYLTADGDAHRLYISRSDRVDVIDTQSGAKVGEVPNCPGIHGIALAPKLGRGFTSNGREGSVTIFDLKSLKEVGRVKDVGMNPDAIIYDP